MLTKLQKLKIKEFKRYLKLFLKEQQNSIENIHKLRLRARELYSLLDTNKPAHTELKTIIKKIIKLTNKVRDLDVFLDEYLPLLPKKYTLELDLESISKNIQEERLEDIKDLHSYLSHIKLTKALYYDENKEEFTLKNKKKLHSYRLYIKKLLYREKNEQLRDEKKIQLLTTIKDLLGGINDNTNALKRLNSLGIDDSLYKKIKKNTKQRDKELFEKFMHFNSLL